MTTSTKHTLRLAIGLPLLLSLVLTGILGIAHDVALFLAIN